MRFGSQLDTSNKRSSIPSFGRTSRTIRQHKSLATFRGSPPKKITCGLHLCLVRLSPTKAENGRLKKCTASVKSCASGSSLFTCPMFPSLPVVGTSESKGKPEAWNPRERPLFLESKFRHSRSDLGKTQ